MKDNNSYALGVYAASNLMKSGVHVITPSDFTEGVYDMMAGHLKISADEVNKILKDIYSGIQKEQEAEAKKVAAENKKIGEDFLKENAKKEGVITTSTGLQYKVLQEGTGKSPNKNDRVSCDYEGRFVDGKKFDSSYDRHQSATFGLNQVIPGWTEGLQLMKEGSKFEFYIPYQLGYGENGMNGAIPPCSTLIFVVELHKVL